MLAALMEREALADDRADYETQMIYYIARALLGEEFDVPSWLEITGRTATEKEPEQTGEEIIGRIIDRLRKGVR